MLRSIRFWTAVLLLVFGAGYTALKKQNFVRSDSSARQIKNISSAVQTEIPKSTAAEGIFSANTDNTEENISQSFHSCTTAVSDITTDLTVSDTAEYEYYEYIEEQSENTPYISEQKITEIREKLDILEFKEMTDEWLDFIIACRSGKPHQHDIVIGAMANDQIYNYVSDYIDGVITREQFWMLAKFKYPTHQINFCTEQALSCLAFYKSEAVRK